MKGRSSETEEEQTSEVSEVGVGAAAAQRAISLHLFSNPRYSMFFIMPDFTSKLVLVQVPQKKAKNFSCYFRAAFSLLEPPCYVATAKRCFSTDVD